MSDLPRVAVFGASGFSGRHFERFVAREGLAREVAFVGHTRRPAVAERSGSFTYKEGDPTSAGEVERFIADVRPDYILNLVGSFRAPDLDGFLALHGGVSRAICEAVLTAGLAPRKILLIGSAAEYGAASANPVTEESPAAPVNPYGLSKVFQTALADYYFRNHGLPIVVARTFNVLGEGLSTDLSIGSFAEQIRQTPEGGAIHVGNLESRRDFLDVGEVVRRYWALLLKGRPGQIYNICSGEPRTIRSVLDQLICDSGKRLRVEVDPARLQARDVASIYGDGSKFDRLER